MELIKGAGIVLCTVLLTGICFGEVMAENSMEEQTALQNCLLRALAKAEDGVTVGELKAQCKAGLAATSKESETVAIDETALEERLEREEEAAGNLWTITPHRQKYLQSDVAQQS